jgi:hypothetical protein
MAINSVGSATYASQQVMTTQARQAEQVQQADQTRQAEKAKEAEQAKRDNEAAESQPSQPVLNAQGQMTGKVINAVA